MRVPSRRIGLVMVVTAATAATVVLLAEQVYTKSASPRSTAPAAVMIEAAHPNLVASEVHHDPGYWYPTVGDHLN